MSECCTSRPESRARHRPCPVSGHNCAAVARRTVLHHLRSPWRLATDADHFYFCDDPDCDVVYFNHRGDTFTRAALRTCVGRKTQAPDATLCYCFGVSFRDARENPACESFVREQTREGVCACATRNPSGRCCLRDFPRRVST